MPTIPYEYSMFKLWKGASNTEVIISAHGGRLPTGGRQWSNLSKQSVPSGMELAFYGPDRHALRSYKIDKEFIVGNLAGLPYKTKSAGAKYVDYYLTKFQGHGSTESYANVEKCLGQFDVITIRNRPLKPPNSIMLSDILATLVEDNRIYKKVHCAFCRTDFVLDLFLGRPTHETPAMNKRSNQQSQINAKATSV